MLKRRSLTEREGFVRHSKFPLAKTMFLAGFTEKKTRPLMGLANLPKPVTVPDLKEDWVIIKQSLMSVRDLARLYRTTERTILSIKNKDLTRITNRRYLTSADPFGTPLLFKQKREHRFFDRETALDKIANRLKAERKQHKLESARKSVRLSTYLREGE